MPVTSPQPDSATLGKQIEQGCSHNTPFPPRSPLSNQCMLAAVEIGFLILVSGFRRFMHTFYNQTEYCHSYQKGSWIEVL
jgi:hypothetical protein